MPPLDSLSRRLLRQAVLRVHPDVFAGADLEAASFNAESLVVREKRERTDEGVADFMFSTDLLDSFALASSAIFSLPCARPSDKCRENMSLDRFGGKESKNGAEKARCDSS